MTIQDRQAIRDFKKAATAAKNKREMFWRSQAPELAFAFDEALHKLKNLVKDPRGQGPLTNRGAYGIF